MGLAAMSYMGKAFLINKEMCKDLVKRGCKKGVPNICMTLHLYRSNLAFFNSVIIMANYLWDFLTKFKIADTYKPAENLVDTQGPVGLPAVPARGERRGEGLDSRHLASPPRG
jgi:hypothetical protein